jgi:hypothetical protein
MTVRGPRVQQILQRLHQGDPRTFDAKEDRECLRDASASFEPYRLQIASPEKTWEISQIALSPANPCFKILEQSRGIRLSWTWRASQGISFCLIAVENSHFLCTPAEAAHPIRIDATEYRRNLGGLLIPLPPGDSQWYVTVWPIIHLGWIELAGQPLHLGPISKNGIRELLARPKV